MSSDKGFIISGIQQVGIGVENLYEAWSYYIDLFNMDIRILEDDKTAELMLPYTGGKPAAASRLHHREHAGRRRLRGVAIR